MLEVKARVPKMDNAVVVAQADVGNDLDDAVARFGKEVVFSNYLASVRITVQSRMRSLKEKGMSDEDIAANIAKFVPGVTAERSVDPTAMLLGRAAKMAPEDLAALIEKLKEKAGL